MLNPYAVRPIGSDVFYEHLKDVQTSRYYISEMPEHGLSKLVFTGRDVCREKASTDPWTRLFLCIVASAVIDYLYAYEQKTLWAVEGEFGKDYWVWNSRCIDLENRFFRIDPWREFIFNRMLTDICWCGTDEIESCIKRVSRFLGWDWKKE